MSFTRIPLSIAIALISACTSPPPTPDWQANAFEALNHFTSAYLSGNTRLANFEFDRAKAEIASTGRADVMARAELVRCAAQMASLNVSPCTGYAPWAKDAALPEQAYATFLSGQWDTLDATQLPAHYQPLLTAVQHHQPSVHEPLSHIGDPLARLVAASLLLKKELLTPVGIALAVDSASQQGWRKPLLAWLGVQLKAAQNKGDNELAERIQRRMKVVVHRAAGDG